LQTGAGIARSFSLAASSAAAARARSSVVAGLRLSFSSLV
jgi:hypothetical protein